MGLVTTILLGALLAQKIGGKMVFGMTVLGSSLLSLFVPFVSEMSPVALFVVRALQGAFQGPLYPALFVLASQWYPKPEKSRLLTCSIAGEYGQH